MAERTPEPVSFSPATPGSLESPALGRRDALRITAVVGVSAALGGGLVGALLRDAGLHRIRRTRTRMGTLVTLTVIHPDGRAGEEMIEDGFAEMERLEGILSRHRPTSALGRLNTRGRLEAAPPELLSVLESALALASVTRGAFDPTVLPILHAYRRSFRATGAPPPAERIRRALELVDHRGVGVMGDAVELARPGMALTLDGIAKGFVVDRTVERLASRGAHRVLVDAGGDIATSRGVARSDPWTVAIQDPHHQDRIVGRLGLRGDAVATSGDYQHTFGVDRSIHHIIDPRTGRSPQEASSVSVVASSAMKADGLSTALMVMGPEQGITHVDAAADAEALMVTKEGRRHASRGFPLLALSILMACAFAVGAPPTASAQPTSLTDAPLFARHDILPVTLAADLEALKDDRSESPDRPGTLTVVVEGEAREIPVEVRTRGAFRLDPSNCSFPPLRIEVDGAAAAGTPFEGQDHLKFVSSCRPERTSWEDLVVKEYLAYRSIGLVTDESFRVRLLEVAFVQRPSGGGPSRGDSGPATRLAFVIEADEALARRLGGTRFELTEGKNLPAGAFHPLSRMTNAVAQYMIANPDWSDVAGHNVEILERAGAALAIPYDFDFSGLVDAPYASAPPEYRLRSVRERYYRGWCESPFVTAEVLRRFRAARVDVVSLWSDARGLSAEARAQGIRFLEGFFDAIESDEGAERRFLRDCRAIPGGWGPEKGRGNVAGSRAVYGVL